MSVRNRKHGYRHGNSKNRIHKGCHEKNKYACNIPICINALGIDNSGIAHSFDNVLESMDYFRKIVKKKRKLMEDTIVMAVGLGKCDKLYKGTNYRMKLCLINFILGVCIVIYTFVK